MVDVIIRKNTTEDSEKDGKVYKTSEPKLSQIEKQSINNKTQ